VPTKPEPVISPISAAYDTSNDNAVKHGCLAWTFCHALCNSLVPQTPRSGQIFTWSPSTCMYLPTYQIL